MDYQGACSCIFPRGKLRRYKLPSVGYVNIYGRRNLV